MPLKKYFHGGGGGWVHYWLVQQEMFTCQIKTDRIKLFGNTIMAVVTSS